MDNADILYSAVATNHLVMHDSET